MAGIAHDAADLGDTGQVQVRQIGAAPDPIVITSGNTAELGII